MRVSVLIWAEIGRIWRDLGAIRFGTLHGEEPAHQMVSRRPVCRYWCCGIDGQCHPGSAVAESDLSRLDVDVGEDIESPSQVISLCGDRRRSDRTRGRPDRLDNPDGRSATAKLVAC